MLQFVGIEAFITVGTDLFSVLSKRKEIFVAVYCIVSYLIGLTMVTRVSIFIAIVLTFFLLCKKSLLSFDDGSALSFFHGTAWFF